MWNNRTLHPHHSCAIHEFTHPSPRHPFLLGTENESETVSADYRGSFSRFSSSLLREKKKFRSISLSPSLPSRSYRWKGKEGREVARNWLSNVGLMTGCRARLCATFIEISLRTGIRLFFLFFFSGIVKGFLVTKIEEKYRNIHNILILYIHYFYERLIYIRFI